jgi:hypothetical protein
VGSPEILDSICYAKKSDLPGYRIKTGGEKFREIKEEIGFSIRIYICYLYHNASLETNTDIYFGTGRELFDRSGAFI